MKNIGNRQCCVSSVAEEYLKGLRMKRYSERSIQTYRDAIRDVISRINKSDVRLISSHDLETYRAGLLKRGFKTSSVAVYFQAIKLFFRYLEERQLIFENPLTGMAPIRVPKLLQPVPSEDEMRILLEQPDINTPLGIRDRAILETMYSTGLRRQETASLNVNAVKLQEGLIRVMGKGQRERMVPLGPTAVEWLGHYLAGVRPGLANKSSGEALWLTLIGKPLDGNSLQYILRQYRKAPGITTPIGLHSIRRACATHMLRRGASPVTIQMLLGHADMKHLSQYLRLSITDLQRAHGASRVGQ